MGCHPAIRVLVQINPGQFGQFVAEPQPNQNPILQRGAQCLLTLPQRFAKSDHARQLGDFPGKRAVFQLVVTRQFKRRFNICRQ